MESMQCHRKVYINTLRSDRQQSWNMDTAAKSSALAESAADAQARFEEICSLLVAAGYFRAR